MWSLAYAQSDPINNADASGHTIGNSSYERQMEAAGGINEIYDFYVGTTLQNAYIRANNAFNSRLNYAYGVDYRNQSAINSIHGISQATANAYIEYGRQAALAIGGTYGCTPGSLTNQAINTFASDVDSARVRVNKRIASVKASKQSKHNAWVAEQARLAATQSLQQLQKTNPSAYNSLCAKLGLSPGASVDSIMAKGLGNVSKAINEVNSEANGGQNGDGQPIPACGDSNADALSNTTEYALYIAKCIGLISSRAVPVLGWAVDYESQLASHESPGDAGIKTTAHAFIGSISETGFAIAGGFAFGPAGAILGGLFGVAVGIAISSVYDYWYDSSHHSYRTIE
jgi:hypothetical protein